MVYSLWVHRTTLFFLTLLPTFVLQAMEEAYDKIPFSDRQKSIFETLASLGYTYSHQEGDSMICSRKFLRQKDNLTVRNEKVELIITPDGKVSRYNTTTCEEEFVMQEKENRSPFWIWVTICFVGIIYGSFKIADYYNHPKEEKYIID